MSGNLKIHLKPNERIFVNGAVVRVDRKVTMQFLNDVEFLLEHHVIQEEDAKTPLRQLYFIVQSMLMEPGTRELAQQIYDHTHRLLIGSFKNQDILEGLVETRRQVEAARYFDALKKIRSLFPIEDLLLGMETELTPSKAAVA